MDSVNTPGNPTKFKKENAGILVDFSKPWEEEQDLTKFKDIRYKRYYQGDSINQMSSAAVKAINTGKMAAEVCWDNLLTESPVIIEKADYDVADLFDTCPSCGKHKSMLRPVFSYTKSRIQGYPKLHMMYFHREGLNYEAAFICANCQKFTLYGVTVWKEIDGYLNVIDYYIPKDSPSGLKILTKMAGEPIYSEDYWLSWLLDNEVLQISDSNKCIATKLEKIMYQGGFTTQERFPSLIFMFRVDEPADIEGVPKTYKHVTFLRKFRYYNGQAPVRTGAPRNRGMYSSKKKE